MVFSGDCCSSGGWISGCANSPRGKPSIGEQRRQTDRLGCDFIGGYCGCGSIYVANNLYCGGCACGRLPVKGFAERDSILVVGA